MASASTTAVQPHPQLGVEPLSYGVELEFIFAFHEDELEPFLQTSQGVRDTIRKDIPLELRIWQKDRANSSVDYQMTKIKDAELPDHPYNSWGIEKGVIRDLAAAGKRALWPYITEPQQILAHKIQKELPNLNTRIHKAMMQTQKTADLYNRWIVTADHSVCGVGSANIPYWLPKATSKDQWDSYGIELVSRVFSTSSEDGQNEIDDVLRVANGSVTDRTGAFITNQCGLHVHVQCPEGIEFLRQLAALLLVYEEEIARLNPPCRRPMHAAAKNNIESNRLGLQLEILNDEDEVNWKAKENYQTVDCSTAEFKMENSVNQIRQRMGLKRDEGELIKFFNWPSSFITRERTGNRNRQVNFTTAIRSHRFPRTIEFRSARGTLSGEDVSRWVDVCVGLVRLATFYAENPDQFPVKGWEETFVNGRVQRNDVNVFTLLNDMVLDEAGIMYWEARVATWMAGTSGDADDRTDSELLNGAPQPPPGGPPIPPQPPPGHPPGPPQPPPPPGPKRPRPDNDDDGGQGPSNKKRNTGVLVPSIFGPDGVIPGGSQQNPLLDIEDAAGGFADFSNQFVTGDDGYADYVLGDGANTYETDLGFPGDIEVLGKGGDAQGTFSKPTSSKHIIPVKSPKGSPKTGNTSQTAGTSSKPPFPPPKNPPKNITPTGSKTPPPAGEKGSKPNSPGKSPMGSQSQETLPPSNSLISRAARRVLEIMLSTLHRRPDKREFANDKDEDTVMGEASGSTSESPKTPPGGQNSNPPAPPSSPGTQAKIRNFIGGTEMLLAMRQVAIAAGDTPVGVLAPNEAMRQDDSGWKIKDFNPSHWIFEPTGESVRAGLSYRRQVCGVVALVQSMRAQYPKYPRMEVETLLRMGDTITRALPGGRDLYDAYDDVIDKLLHNWTDGKYILVVVDSKGDARRVGDIVSKQERFGKSLYVRHLPRAKGLLDSRSGHYESMRKKPEYQAQEEEMSNSFNRDHWRMLRTAQKVHDGTENRQACSGLVAITQSMREQYPLVEPLSVFNLLHLADTISQARTGHRFESADAELINMVLDSWTGGRYNLTVVQGDDETSQTTRVTGSERQSTGMDLYVYLKVPGPPPEEDGHWVSMRKRTEEELNEWKEKQKKK